MNKSKRMWMLAAAMLLSGSVLVGCQNKNGTQENSEIRRGMTTLLALIVITTLNSQLGAKRRFTYEELSTKK